MSRSSFPLSPFRLVAGLVVLAVGVILILEEMGYPAAQYLDYWPLGLVALGAIKALGRRPQDWIVALLLVGLGAWLLLYNLDYVTEGPWEFFWPVVLMILGANLVFGALRRGNVEAGAASDSYLSVYAVLCGADRKVGSDDFRGADATAIMGGGTIDLRGAQIPSGTAEVRVLAFWGGVDLLVPPDWRIDFRLLPILGGYDDTTQQEPGPDSPTLRITGSVIMGGLELKN